VFYILATVLRMIYLLFVIGYESLIAIFVPEMNIGYLPVKMQSRSVGGGLQKSKLFTLPEVNGFKPKEHVDN